MKYGSFARSTVSSASRRSRSFRSIACACPEATPPEPGLDPKSRPSM